MDNIARLSENFATNPLPFLCLSVFKLAILNIFASKFQEMNNTDKLTRLFKQYTIFILSLFVVSLGVALSLRANLGSSPVSVIPFVWSKAQGLSVDIFGYAFSVPSLSLGTYTICWSAILILIQIVMLRNKYRPIQLLQITTGLFFGMFIDISMYLTSFLQWGDMPADYVVRFIQVLVGCCVLGFGIACEVRCNVPVLLPPDGFTVTLAKKAKLDFGKAKIYSDTGIVIAGIVFCMLFFRSWQWNMIGVGTLTSMIFVGVMVRFFSPRMGWLDVLLAKPREDAVAAEISADSLPLVITIAREFGSGGHEIGGKLAKLLGMEFYDRKIIDRTAEELGVRPDEVEENEQYISTPKLLELILTDKQIPTAMGLSENDAIFVAQSRIIRNIARQKPSVIIGRCADYILKDHPHCFRVFVQSDMDFARKRVMKEFALTPEEADNKIHHTNQARANHYWQYTGNKWEDAKHYDLIVNSSKLGIEGVVNIIAEAVEQIKKER